MSGAVAVCPGSRFAFDGEVVEVTGFEGTRVTLRDARDRWRTLALAGFLARAAPLEAPQARPAPAGPLLAGLSGGERSAVTERAGHVREVLTGYRSGTAEVARPGEPRPDYDPARPLGGRQEAKARELGVSGRTIRRWVRAYRDGGEAGLADARRVSGRRPGLDPRWEHACRTVVAGQVGTSTPTAGALLRLTGARLDDQYGPGAVPRPSTAAAYRHLARLTKGTNALTGSAKGRRSIAGRPKGAYGRLRAARPGEYVILDTQDLDVFAMEPVTCRWVRAQLTGICARLNTDRCRYDHSPCSHGDPRGRCTTRPGTLPIRKRWPPGFGVRRTAYGRSWMKREYRTGCRSCCRRGSSTTPS